jgi:hypothetical protein
LKLIGDERYSVFKSQRSLKDEIRTKCSVETYKKRLTPFSLKFVNMSSLGGV